MTVFDKAWFAAHQCSLCAALNVPVFGRELRWALGIHLEGPIVEVYPHASVMWLGPGRRHAEFYSRPIIAQRMHAHGSRLWRMLHWFDQHVANPLVPALNLGFDSLTFYSDANPETTTFDGWIMRFIGSASTETFSDLHDLPATTANHVDGDGYLIVETATDTDKFSDLRRLTHLFDTSALTKFAYISAASFSVWSLNRWALIGETDLNVVLSDPEVLTGYESGADYERFLAPYVDETSLGSTPCLSYDFDVAYLATTINDVGRGYISKTGITKFGTRLTWDVDNNFGGTWTGNTLSGVRYYLAENASGTAKAPKLDVTYQKKRLFSLAAG